ncbi:MAG: murein transglycosylase A [Sphingopyxis terrae]|uniref:peptidoglycan lytic exotransglycosylase n=1 Tax=Sphingopyxis terrae subsp. terrae NBRC 15098 TaxID=1219058 RepID=A0A142VY92_9SPHN|nr:MULTISPECIES: murein transglycosylase A [Sphingopyxis]AMU94788.1 MltA [Sphingopyxis terrae subsp. terrae NBRC 15098]MBU7590753.1 murein transglycosylase A [Sphingopyxis terrae]
MTFRGDAVPDRRPRLRCVGLALLLTVPLLSGCASVIPAAAGPRPAPATNPTPTPAPTTAAPRPYQPRPSVPPGAAAKPIPATPNPPLAAPPVPATATSAVESGVVAGPEFNALGIAPEQATAALIAFRLSCPSVQRRTDASGLTQPSEWAEACSAASGWADRDAGNFFSRYFGTVQVGAGTAFVTGYYEPEIAASRTRRPGYDVPIYRRPADLVDVDLGLFSKDLQGKKIRGRVDGSNFIPYFDRLAIERGALAGRGLEIAWAADAAEFFFLQVQGSGRLRLPDGGVMRIGYDSQNGRDYVGIGKLLLDRGALQPGQASMQGILDYLRADPVRGAAVMNENPSWVFFRELTGPGPLGALGVPVTGRASVAADPKYVPLGAPVFLSLDRAEPNGLWVAQDTGGAIKGANRFDSFWGAGDKARAIAGGMAARGSALILLPRAAVARLTAAAR